MSNGLNPIERRIKVINFVKNDVASESLARTHPYKEFLLRLSGQLVIGTNPATSVVPYAPLSLIKAIRLILNGEMGIKAYNGKLDYIQNQLDSAVPGEKVAPGTTVGTHNFSGALKVYFELPGYPEDWNWLTKLNSALLTELTIEILFGQETDLVVQGTAVLTIQNCKVEVFALEYPDVEAQRVYSIFKEYTKRITVPGATTELPLEIKSRNEIISIMINSVDNNVDADTLVNKVSAVIDGTDYRKVMTWQALKQLTQDHYACAPPMGIVALIFDKSRDLSQVLKLMTTTDFFLIFDVNAPTGTSYIDVLVREVIPFSG